MKKAAFYTLGCKVNQYETQALINQFETEGYEVVDFNDIADVYVINTCTVTNLGDRKSRQFIRRAKGKNKNAVIAVIGCYAQVNPDEIMKLEDIDIIMGTQEKDKLLDFVESVIKTGKKINCVQDIMNITEFEDMEVVGMKNRTRAYIKIQDGCGQFCSYCIVPYARGPLRSRKPESIVREAERLARNGFKEIVLTGIHIASYGKDNKEFVLLDVIKTVHGIEGVCRIRLSSIEPTLLTESFIQQISSLEKVCRHYHVSLQSGSNETLKRMNRRYTTDEYRVYIDTLREYLPEVSVTTDIMVGFPGETEREFEDTCKFVEEIGFSGIHVFKYSTRKGTPAAEFPDQVIPYEKEKRSRILIALGKKLEIQYMKGFLGKKQPVLFEGRSNQREEFYEGHTDNYLKVLVKSQLNELVGELIEIELKDIKYNYFIGVFKTI